MNPVYAGSLFQEVCRLVLSRLGADAARVLHYCAMRIENSDGDQFYWLSNDITLSEAQSRFKTVCTEGEWR